MSIGSTFVVFLVQVSFFVINRVSPEENVTLYLILSAITGLFIGGPYSRMFGNDFIEAGNGDSTQTYYIFAAANLFKHLGLALCLFVIGSMMQRGKNKL